MAGLLNRTVQYIHPVIRKTMNQTLKWGSNYRYPTYAVMATTGDGQSCRIVGLDDDSITLSHQAWCANQAHLKIVESDLLERIYEAFEKQVLAAPRAIQMVIVMT